MSEKSKEKERIFEKQFEKLSDIDKIRFNLNLIRGDSHLYGGSTFLILFYIIFLISNNIFIEILAIFASVYFFLQTKKFLSVNLKLRKKFLEEYSK